MQGRGFLFVGAGLSQTAIHIQTAAPKRCTLSSRLWASGDAPPVAVVRASEELGVGPGGAGGSGPPTLLSGASRLSRRRWAGVGSRQAVFPRPKHRESLPLPWKSQVYSTC
ncbi:UNVERIFIED_CONTAM: hypothetical protein K2H54_069924 [Gekko kuhli]